MLTKTIEVLSPVVDDLLFLIGAGLISYGTFTIYIPAGYIALGMFLVIIAYLLARKKDT